MKLNSQDKALLTVITSTGALLVCVLVLLVSAMSVEALRAWAVVSVVVIPLAFFAGWRLGTRDSRAHLSGLDKGVDVATRAITRTGRARQAVTSTPQPLRLPDPEIIHVRPASDDEVIDL
jgi:hypothetical protein